MSLTLRLTLTMHEREKSYPSFSLELENERGEREQRTVYLCPGYELDGDLGEVRDDKIFLRKMTPPILAPIIAQMVYFRDLGYDDDTTQTAGILYGMKVLKDEDLECLVAHLGDKTTALVAAGSSSDGNTDYYVRHLGQYLERYEGNRWVARGRVAASLGIQSLVDDWGGRSTVVAMKILDEDAIFRKSGAERVMVQPPMRHILSEVIAGLEKLASELTHSGQKVTIEEPTLIRALYFFTDEFVHNSPVVFQEDRADASVVQFDRYSASMIGSVVKQLKVGVNNERKAVTYMLEAAQRKFGVLAGGSFRELMGSSKEMAALSPAQVEEIKGDMKKLLRRKKELEGMLVGRRPKRRTR